MASGHILRMDDERLVKLAAKAKVQHDRVVEGNLFSGTPVSMSYAGGSHDIIMSCETTADHNCMHTNSCVDCGDEKE